MAVSLLDVHQQFFDDSGAPLAFGFVYTYDALTDDPLAAYTDATGLNAHQTRITLDSAGRPPSPIYWTVGAAYKTVLETSANVVLDTVTSFTIPDNTAAAASQYADVVVTFTGGPPTATQWLGGERLARAISFLANWNGSYGKVPLTVPAATFIVTIKKNNVTVGTASSSTAGVWTFATSAGAIVNFAAGDEIDFYGPAVADTNMANFGLTLAGTLA